MGSGCAGILTDMLPPGAYDLAELQLSVISRVQLGRWLRHDQIDHRIGPGRELRRLERGVFVLNGAGKQAAHPAFAAALRAGPSATVTGPVVLGLLGLEKFVSSELFEILTAPGRRVRGVGFPHRIDPDPARPVTQYGEIRIAAPVDGLIDTAGFIGQLEERDLRVTYGQCRWLGLFTPEHLRARMQVLGPGSPGVAVLTELFEQAGLVPESEGERELGRLLRAFEPEPEPQVYITPNRRVDWYFRSVRFAYEYLGSVDHEGVAARIADDERNQELRDQGIRVGYVTAADLRTPDALVASIIGRLAVRGHELAVTGPVARRRR
jgi:hypothetical protein